MKNRFLTAVLIWVIFVGCGSPYVARAQVITAPQIDALVQRTLTTFYVPGIISNSKANAFTSAALVC